MLLISVSSSYAQNQRDTIRPNKERKEKAEGTKGNLMDSLNLSREQKKQMAEISKKFREDMKFLQEDKSVDRREKMEKLREVSQQYKDKARTILDSTQYQQFSESLRERMQEKLKERRGKNKI
jgi:Spy/CpxP family protein refolding chaperone